MSEQPLARFALCSFFGETDHEQRQGAVLVRLCSPARSSPATFSQRRSACRNSQRAVIKRTLEQYVRAIGRPAKAWLSSALRGTVYTPAFLKEFGLIAYCDYLNDDQPYLIQTTHGPIVCVPYSNDINDFNLFARGGMSASAGLETLKLCFGQLYAESAASGRLMNFGMHPHVMGQAHRIGALRDFIGYAKSHEGVWFASREEIATWYLDIHEAHIS